MVDETTVRLIANGNGAQPFFAGEFLRDSACPLRQGQECSAQAIPGVGVLLTPVHDDQTYRIEVADDQQPEVTPNDI